MPLLLNMANYFDMNVYYVHINYALHTNSLNIYQTKTFHNFGSIEHSTNLKDLLIAVSYS